MANKKLLLPTLLTAAALAPGVAQAGMGDIYMELNNVQVEAQTKANKSRKGWQDKPVEGLFNPVEKVTESIEDPAFGATFVYEKDLESECIPANFEMQTIGIDSMSSWFPYADAIGLGTLNSDYVESDVPGAWVSSVKDRALNNDAYLSLKDEIGFNGTHDIMDRWGTVGSQIIDVNLCLNELEGGRTAENISFLRADLLKDGRIALPKDSYLETLPLAKVAESNNSDDAEDADSSSGGLGSIGMFPGFGSSPAQYGLDRIEVLGNEDGVIGKIKFDDLKGNVPGRSLDWLLLLGLAGLGAAAAYSLGKETEERIAQRHYASGGLSTTFNDFELVMPRADENTGYQTVLSLSDLMGTKYDSKEQEVFEFPAEDLVRTQILEIPALSIEEDYDEEDSIDTIITSVKDLNLYEGASGQDIYSDFNQETVSSSNMKSFENWSQEKGLTQDDKQRVRDFQEQFSANYFMDMKSQVNEVTGEKYTNAEIVRGLQWELGFGVSKSTVYRRIKNGLNQKLSSLDSEFETIKTMADAQKAFDSVYSPPPSGFFESALNN